jgi:hypothetical protein
MAIYHLIHPRIWSDPWFSAMNRTGKLLFLYLLTSPDNCACGIFLCPTRKMAFDTGLSRGQVESALEDFSGHVAYDAEAAIVWIVNAARYWLDNPKVMTAIRKQVDSLNGHRFTADFRKRYPSIWQGE